MCDSGGNGGARSDRGESQALEETENRLQWRFPCFLSGAAGCPCLFGAFVWAARPHVPHLFIYVYTVDKNASRLRRCWVTSGEGETLSVYFPGAVNSVANEEEVEEVGGWVGGWVWEWAAPAYVKYIHQVFAFAFSL